MKIDCFSNTVKIATINSFCLSSMTLLNFMNFYEILKNFNLGLVLKHVRVQKALRIIFMSMK